MSHPAKPQPRLLIYTGDNCPYCRQLKQFLQQLGRPYQERNIQRSASAAAEYRQLGLRGIPVLLLGKQIIPGFQPERIRKALGLGEKAKPGARPSRVGGSNKKGA
ncbi:MAG: glutaredoxin family protein [Gammaproteobacteria bacterium]|nr:glutaredoxin family protein [Gammaproteobacteria bacterium]